MVSVCDLAIQSDFPDFFHALYSMLAYITNKQTKNNDKTKQNNRGQEKERSACRISSRRKLTVNA